MDACEEFRTGDTFDPKVRLLYHSTASTNTLSKVNFDNEYLISGPLALLGPDTFQQDVCLQQVCTFLGCILLL